MKKTKIVCTMGPNTNDREMMRKLIQNGMNVARFNFSHGDHEEQKFRMDMLKELREEEHTNTAILLDTKGPEIRTGILKDGKKITLKEGETFTLTTEDIVGDNKRVSITYKGLYHSDRRWPDRTSCREQDRDGDCLFCSKWWRTWRKKRC